MVTVLVPRHVIGPSAATPTVVIDSRAPVRAVSLRDDEPCCRGGVHSSHPHQFGEPSEREPQTVHS